MQSLRSKFLHTPLYDYALLLMAPAIALIFAFALAPLMNSSAKLFGVALPLLIMSFGIESFQDTSTIFRAYLNPVVFRTYWKRLTIFPLVGLFLVFVSNDFLVLFVILDIFWDLYHSSMQTFGIGRVYHVMAGGDTHQGRRQDMALNLIIYIFPIFALLAPASQEFIDPLFALEGTIFSRVALLGDLLEAGAPYFFWPFTLAQFFFICYYALWTYGQYRQGHPVSLQKLTLFSVTGLSVFSIWHFCPPMVIYVSLELYHAMHTWGITYWSEKKTLAQTFNLKQGWKFFIFVAGIICVAGVLEVMSEWAHQKGMQVYGIGDERWLLADKNTYLGIFVKCRLIFMLLHAWSDIWIWSVRKKEVQKIADKENA